MIEAYELYTGIYKEIVTVIIVQCHVSFHLHNRDTCAWIAMLCNLMIVSILLI